MSLCIIRMFLFADAFAALAFCLSFFSSSNNKISLFSFCTHRNITNKQRDSSFVVALAYKRSDEERKRREGKKADWFNL